MKTVNIEPVDSRTSLKEFIGLPARLYKNLPNYTAPLNMESRALLDPRKAPFFKHGEAQYWIARVDREAVGRISAQIDDAQPAGTFDDAGVFGCLDAIDDAAVVRALIDTAQNWLREKGKARAMGPCTLSMNGEPGLLVEGHAETRLSLVPWHPHYLAAHLEACGYSKCRDLHYWRIRNTEDFRSSASQRKKIPENWVNFTFRSLDWKNLDRDIDIFREVYNDAWQDNWGFVPLMPEDLHAVGHDLKPFMKPEYGVIAEMDGRAVGVALVLPNLFEITGDLGANPSLIGWVKLAYRTFFHRFRSGRIILLGVLSECRRSIGGPVIAASMVEELTKRLMSIKYHADWIEAGWVLDNNTALIGILRRYGFERTRTLRLYDKSLANGEA